MKKILSLLVIGLLSFSVVGCSSTTSKSEVETNILDAIDYYEKSYDEVSKLAEEKDEAKMITKLEEVTKYLDEKTDYFLKEMNNEENSENIKEACMNIKTAFYGASTEGYKPMLAVFKKESNSVPQNYKDVMDQCQKLLDEAINLIK